MINQNKSMWSMKSSILIIFVSTLFATQCSAQITEPTYFLDFCSNITSNTIYSANLQTVLTTLQQQASTSRFHNASAGSGSDEVHGQYYCRGDIDSSLCSTCIQQASETVLKNCTNLQTAVIWYDLCTLRYHNVSTFGLALSSPAGYGWSPSLNVTDPATFSAVLNTTVERVINESAYGNDSAGFAVADAPVSALESVYLLVQCSPDLTPIKCELCLRTSYVHISTCCGNWPKRARVFLPSCQMRYSNVQFYNTPPGAAASPPPQMLSPPPPLSLQPPPPPPLVTTSTLNTTDGGNTGRSGRVKLGLSVTLLAFFTLLVNMY